MGSLARDNKTKAEKVAVVVAAAAPYKGGRAIPKRKRLPKPVWHRPQKGRRQLVTTMPASQIK